MKEYKNAYFKPGRVEWLIFTPVKRGELVPAEYLLLTREDAIDGDHKRSPRRQVTLIQQENIDQVAAFLELSSVDPKLLRRNIVISGINLEGFQEKNVKLGDEVVLKITGPCAPCEMMEKNLGNGGYTAMCGNGGYTCIIVEEGKIHSGDPVIPLP